MNISDFVKSYNWILKISRIKKHVIENIDVNRKHIATMFSASLFFLGNMIATSYLPAAIIPKIVHILIYKPYVPKSSAVKY